MYYIFSPQGTCLCSCDQQPNRDDCAARGEVTAESTTLYDISRIELRDGEIKECAPVNEIGEEVTANIPETELAIMEGMVDMQSRITTLEAELAHLKGGE